MHLITAGDVEVAWQIRALLDKEIVAQDLPKSSPDRETASESMPEAV
jgi:hypothetical protein